jgi:SNF2 family DNA or RNA helicase
LRGSKEDRHFRNTLNLSATARECALWFQDKAEVKAVKLPVLQNLFHVENHDGSAIAIHGSSPFTSAGLGAVPSDGYEMNTCFTTPEETTSLIKWFDSIWSDPDATKDVKGLLLTQLEDIFASKSPELVYFLTLYNVFREYLGELEEDKIIKTRTGIKNTLVWGKLYRFQRDGVLGAIDKIERYNGCIIADSVGLGKTFEALAIIKYYELRNDRVLVLCPKKLRENWTLYTANDRHNLFAADRFNFDVLNHTDLTRVGGKSGEINLETLNWGNYDLVVIDESHNFRNNPPRKDGLTRYSRLMRQIIKEGVKTRVLMLSATPVNSRMNDLKNQVAFITEGVDDALYNSGIASIEQTLRKAQTRFNQWLDLASDERTTQRLLEALNLDYFKLLDLLTIARSRKHIEKYYDLDEVGAFAERAKPINIKADIDTKNISSWAGKELGIHSALVTGKSGGNKTTMPGLRKDIASVITSFSPVSKERIKIDESLTDKISILISTDCLSEGQNLQDCDYVINYVIHWNPVRIIQRFGRIDRLGSRNEIIQLVNFWPNMELDEYINLEARVSGRMVLLDISATGEENIIEFPDAGKMNDLEYRRRQLEKLQNEVIDLEDLGGGISITDMTLNDFRMDLIEYLKGHADRLKHMPPGAFAVTCVDDLVDIEEGLGPGVIFCLRSETARIRSDGTHVLAPYYLVWLSGSGDVQLHFTQAKKILDLFKKLSLGGSRRYFPQ